MNAKKWYKRRWVYYLYLFLLLFPLAEVATRIMGYQPYVNEDYSISSSPDACIKSDLQYGLALVPGSYKTTINRQHTYAVQHTKDGQRVTPFNTANQADSVYLMGCSFTYGMGVNDTETFASRLQVEHSNYRFVNFGVPGYGTIQSFLQLQEKLASGSHPEKVVLNFSKLHFDRNALTPTYRRNLKIGFERSNIKNAALLKDANFPYIDGENMNEIKHVQWKDIYHNWMGRETFSTINFLNIQSDHSTAAKIDDYKITEHLIERLNKLCLDNNIDLLVCLLDSDQKVRKLIQFCKTENIDIVKVGLTHKDPDLTNLPHDSHPNAKGHKLISNKISTWLNN